MQAKLELPRLVNECSSVVEEDRRSTGTRYTAPVDEEHLLPSKVSISRRRSNATPHDGLVVNVVPQPIRITDHEDVFDR